MSNSSRTGIFLSRRRAMRLYCSTKIATVGSGTGSFSSREPAEPATMTPHWRPRPASAPATLLRPSGTACAAAGRAALRPPAAGGCGSRRWPARQGTRPDPRPCNGCRPVRSAWRSPAARPRGRSCPCSVPLNFPMASSDPSLVSGSGAWTASAVTRPLVPGVQGNGTAADRSWLRLDHVPRVAGQRPASSERSPFLESSRFEDPIPAASASTRRPETR